MSGFELSGLIRFFIQLGAALAGSASFWGFVLAKKAKNSGPGSKRTFQLVNLLFALFIIGFLFFLFNWFLGTTFFYPAKLFGHEGVALEPSKDFITGGFGLGSIFVFVLLILTLLTSFLYFNRRKTFQKYAAPLFLFKFLLFSSILSFTVFTGEWDRIQAFFSLHGWHSILTLGTVITVDFLYTAAFRRNELKKILYPFFHYMSLAIWLGLGIDFVSVFLVLGDVFEVSTQFLFNQTLIGVIIINGAFLSGRVNDKLIDFAKKGRAITRKLNNLFNILGAVSIVSWTGITFLDFFEFDATYLNFLFIYLVAIIFALFLEYCARRIHFKMHNHKLT